MLLLIAVGWSCLFVVDLLIVVCCVLCDACRVLLMCSLLFAVCCSLFCVISC